MQMLPYLELPVILPAIESIPEKVVPGKFLPMQVVVYHEIDEDQMMIYLQNGQPFLIGLKVSEYESKIKAYYDLISKPQGKEQGRIHKIN